MITKGSARGRPLALAQHLLRTDHNEAVHVLEISGCVSMDLTEALKEIHDIGAGTQTRRTLYHANIDPRMDEQFTREQKRIAVRRLAEKLGFENQPRAVVEHVKAGRGHLHVVFGRIDLDTMTAISDSHNFRKHEEYSRELEREFGHQHTRGAHVRDKAVEPRPERAHGFMEHQQAARSGLSPQEAKRIVTECWQATRSGRGFQARLEVEGFTLARGDRRDFVLIDQAGEVHSLAKRIAGAKAQEVRERLSDLDAGNLPDVAEAKRRSQLRQQADQQNAPAFTTVAERIRADEIAEQTGQEKVRWSAFEREAAAAIHHLDPTMGWQLKDVVTADDRRTADKTWQEVLRETETIDDRRAREAGTRTAERERRRSEATRSTPEIEPSERTIWQRVKGWVRGLGSSSSGNAADEAQRSSAQQQKSPAREAQLPQPRRSPSARLFFRIFGVLVDAYQKAFDRAVQEHATREAGRHPRRASTAEARERSAAPPHARSKDAPTPSATDSLLQDIADDRTVAKTGTDRLRDVLGPGTGRGRTRSRNLDSDESRC